MKKDELNLECQFILNQLWIIDIPVLLGLLAIFFFSKNLQEIDPIDTDAKAVFTVGSIAIHLILSQIIFLLFNTRHLFGLYKLKIACKS